MQGHVTNLKLSCGLSPYLSHFFFAIYNFNEKKKNIRSLLKLGSSYRLQLELALYISVKQSRTCLVFSTMVACCKKIDFHLWRVFFKQKWQFSGVLNFA